MAIVVMNFSLDDERDADIIEFLGSQPGRRRSAAIRAAVRAYLSRDGGPTLADIMAEIQALPSRMTIVAPTDGDGNMPEEEPEEAAKNLDGFLDRLGDLG